MTSHKNILSQLFLPLFFLLPTLSKSQGIEIEPGANVSIVGEATIEINNGNFINNGTYTKASEIMTFSGATPGEISGSSASVINDLRIVNTGGVVFEIGTSVTEVVVVDEASTLVIEKGTELALSGSIKLKAKGKKRGQYFNNVDGRVDSIEQEYAFEGGVWSFFAPPVDMLAGDVFPDLILATEGFEDLNADYWLVEYSQSDRAIDGSGMKDITDNAQQLKRGQGYMVWVTDDQIGSYRYLSSDAPSSIDATVSNTQAFNNSGWNLVGNPFTYTFSYDDIFDCAYNASHFIGGVYLWDGDGYKVWVDGLGDVEASEIGPLESFFVKVNQVDDQIEEVSTVGFCMERGACDCTSTDLKSTHINNETSSSLDALSIKVTASGKDDKTYLRVHPDATLSLDDQWDAQKFETINAYKPIIFTKDNQAIEYAVNAFPVLESVEEIPLQINLHAQSASINLSFEIQGDSSYKYELYDAYTGTAIRIVSGEGITVETNGETYIEDRLFLQVYSGDKDVSTEIYSVEKIPMMARVCDSNTGMRVLSYLDDVLLEVYDISGNSLFRKSLYGNEEIFIDLPQNVYIVKTKRGERMETQKIVVR